MGHLTSAQGWSLRAKRAGQMRAAFWRNLGFPNCTRARERMAELREQRRRLAVEALQRIEDEKVLEEIPKGLRRAVAN